MTFQILTTGAPTFNYMMEPGSTCATSATVRLFLERKNDDLSEELYRWWANSTIYDLQTTSENVTMTVPLTPNQWSSVYGKPGNLNGTTRAGFQDLLTNLGHVGMTFGGRCFAGHGVNVSGGTARFALISETIHESHQPAARHQPSLQALNQNKLALMLRRSERGNLVTKRGAVPTRKRLGIISKRCARCQSVFRQSFCRSDAATKTHKRMLMRLYCTPFQNVVKTSDPEPSIAIGLQK